MESEVKITSISELREYKNGEVIELPPFSENQRFFARIKRPSLLALIKGGQIPNELLTAANSLFNVGSKSFSVLDNKTMDNLFDVMEIICESAFVEPTYKEIKDAGVSLTDEQILFIFGYAQNGVRQLKSFR